MPKRIGHLVLLLFEPKHMKNEMFYDAKSTISNASAVPSLKVREQFRFKDHVNTILKEEEVLPPEILFLTSYPPRECGIANYSQDLIKSLDNKFTRSFSLKVCAFETSISTNLEYPEEVKYVLDTSNPASFLHFATVLNNDERIQFIVVQHEFGFFAGASESAFLQFLKALTKPILLVFHTVLPTPDEALKQKVLSLASASASIVVMTHHSAMILQEHYGVPTDKIEIIAHGTHLVPHLSKAFLKEKYGLAGRKVLSTFGLLGSGKSIETTLEALPAIIKVNPDILFLIIGKTHPGIIKSEGETYRKMLEDKIADLNLSNHVKFINSYLPLTILLEYLQLTDIYLFTSKDRNQAVSGTFSYAMSCGCPIISTPIPHALEVLCDDTGILIDFQQSAQLAAAVNLLMSNETLRAAFSMNTLQSVVPTSWENSAIAHAQVLQKLGAKARLGTQNIHLNFRYPEINLGHLKKMTTDIGIIQFSKINQPDLESGYTLDDNARALIAICMHFQLTGDLADLEYVKTYVDFIKFCQLPDGQFLNYVDHEQRFTQQNHETNLSDSNGRAIWSLGFVMSMSNILPADVVIEAEKILYQAMPHAESMHSTRSMAFTIKGLYYANLKSRSPQILDLIKILSDRMVQMFRHEAEPNWQWFESYLTYGNCILPEALLCAFRATGNLVYLEIARDSFDFLLLQTFNDHRMKVISNKTWLKKGEIAGDHGEQPIDVAYTILALHEFYKILKTKSYLHKMTTAFNWFLGNNHLHQIIYNPCTGGCYDGLEEHHVNLNQGAESTLSYLIARLTMEKHN
jgi:glycosyltransferase involved in cell wall biosynthesis